MLLQDEEWSRWSDREIARRTGVDHKTVGNVRNELSGEIPQITERKVQRGETVYTQNTSNIGRKPKPQDEPLPEQGEPQDLPGIEDEDTIPESTIQDIVDTITNPSPELVQELEQASEEYMQEVREEEARRQICRCWLQEETRVWSDNQIASRCELDVKTVGNLRRSLWNFHSEDGLSCSFAVKAAPYCGLSRDEVLALHQWLLAVKVVPKDAILCNIKAGSKRDAQLHSIEANQKHGLRRTNADKRKSVTMLLQDEEWREWSDSEIGRRAGVDHKTVARYKSDLGISQVKMRTYTDRHGNVSTMNTANIGRKPKPQDEPLPEQGEPQDLPGIEDEDTIPESTIQDIVDTITNPSPELVQELEQASEEYMQEVREEEARRQICRCWLQEETRVWSDNQIASRCELDVKTVGNLRRSLWNFHSEDGLSCSFAVKAAPYCGLSRDEVLALHQWLLAVKVVPKDAILCNIKAGSKRDAQLHSIEANQKHGLRRTNADKRKSVTMLLQDEEWKEWSDREVARRAGVHHQMVGTLRSSLDDSPSERKYTDKHE